MEDPWANAWGDSSKSVLPEPNPLWAAPSVSVLHADNESEDDLSTPSWPKDSVASWGASDLSVDHIWSTTEISSTWNPGTSTFDEISFAGHPPQKRSQSEIQEAGNYPASSLSLDGEEAWSLPKTQLQVIPPTLPPNPIFIPTETLERDNLSNVKPGNKDEGRSRSSQLSPSPTLSPPKPTSAPSSEDIDGFGSFETGEVDQEKGSWTPTNSVLPPISDSANWDSAWQVESEDGKNEQEDAWEAARMQKETRDRHVRPELLSSILEQLEELSKDIWEDLGTSSADVNDNLDFEMLGLNTVLTRLSPDDLTLPPTVPFAKTFTMKHMSESLKLSRHYKSMRLSPMAMYLASKGSNSWEAAVKARSIVASDDVTPVGWKIMDTSIQEKSPVDDGKKKVGGIFSFFGRRTHNLSVDGHSKRSASPTTISGTTSSMTPTLRVGSPATVEPSNTLERSKTTTSETPTVVSEVDHKSPSTIPTGDAAKSEIQPEAPQPSAVSRFLERIVGRSKTPSIDSLALSADDLEFLADVPTSSNTDGLKNDDLTNILETLPPPRPVAPPLRQESPLPRLPPPPNRPTRAGGRDDLLSSFDPTPIPTQENGPLTMNSPPCAMPVGKTGKSPISALPPNQLWTTFEEPAVKSTSSRHPSVHSVDLLQSSSSRLTNGLPIKRDVHSVPKFMATTSIPVLAPPISPSMALPLEHVQVDDDEFSDFLSSPAVQNSQFNSFSLDSSLMPIPSIKTTDTHANFGEFREALNDFPTPKPRSSSQRAPATVSVSSTQSEVVHTRKASKKADHSRTLSLLETAATRARWLSPPSPIPEALSPPPNSSGTVYPESHNLDMQSQQALAMAAYSASDMAADNGTNAWRLPPPPSGTLLRPSLIPSTLVHPGLTPPSRPEFVAQSSRSPSSVQLGGLSAQDLSFFEGL